MAPSAAWASSWSRTRVGAAAEEGRPTTMSRMQKRVCVCVGQHCERSQLGVLELGGCSAVRGRKSRSDGEVDDGEEVIPA